MAREAGRPSLRPVRPGRAATHSPKGAVVGWPAAALLRADHEHPTRRCDDLVDAYSQPIAFDMRANRIDIDRGRQRKRANELPWSIGSAGAPGSHTDGPVSHLQTWRHASHRREVEDDGDGNGIFA